MLFRSHLKSIVLGRDMKLNWSLYLPLVARTINQTWHSAIDCAPARLVQGSIASLQRSLLATNEDDEVIPLQRTSEYLDKLLKAQSAILNASAKFQAQIMNKFRTKNCNQNVRFENGSYVLWMPPTKTDKFQFSWAGPYKVINQGSQLNSYIIEDVLTKRQRTVHISTIKE